MFIERGYSKRFVLKVLSIRSSTWYKRASQKAHKREEGKSPGRPTHRTTTTISGEVLTDFDVINLALEVRSREFQDKYGYRKILPYLERDYGVVINHKKFFRIYTEAGLGLPLKKKSKRRGKKVCKNRKVTGPNELWQFDIKYGYIDGENRYFFLMGLIDVFTRKVVEYHVGTKCQAKDILVHLERAIEKENVNPANLAIRSDNGPQMTSYQFKKFVEDLNLEHEFTPPSTPNLNAFIESFFSIVDRELFR